MHVILNEEALKVIGYKDPIGKTMTSGGTGNNDCWHSRKRINRESIQARLAFSYSFQCQCC